MVHRPAEPRSLLVTIRRVRHGQAPKVKRGRHLDVEAVGHFESVPTRQARWRTGRSDGFVPEIVPFDVFNRRGVPVDGCASVESHASCEESGTVGRRRPPNSPSTASVRPSKSLACPSNTGVHSSSMAHWALVASMPPCAHNAVCHATSSTVSGSGSRVGSTLHDLCLADQVEESDGPLGNAVFRGELA